LGTRPPCHWAFLSIAKEENEGKKGSRTKAGRGREERVFQLKKGERVVPEYTRKIERYTDLGKKRKKKEKLRKAEIWTGPVKENAIFKKKKINHRNFARFYDLRNRIR